MTSSLFNYSTRSIKCCLFFSKFVDFLEGGELDFVFDEAEEL